MYLDRQQALNDKGRVAQNLKFWASKLEAVRDFDKYLNVLDDAASSLAILTAEANRLRRDEDVRGRMDWEGS